MECKEHWVSEEDMATFTQNLTRMECKGRTGKTNQKAATTQNLTRMECKAPETVPGVQKKNLESNQNGM